MNLDQLFDNAMKHGDDIRDHLSTLREYAAECSHITEFGVRHGWSTMALMAGKPARLISYDIEPCPNMPILQASAKENGIDFTFVLADDRQVDIEPTELLLIDTYHNYQQLDTELRRHTSQVSRYIILHDTYVPPENGDSKGMWIAILKLLQGGQWQIWEDFDNCNGLTVLKRIDHDRNNIVSSEWVAQEIQHV